MQSTKSIIAESTPRGGILAAYCEKNPEFEKTFRAGWNRARGADFKPRLRDNARVLSALTHTSPERDAFLKTIGIRPEQLSERHLRLMSASILKQLDQRHAELAYVVSHDKSYSPGAETPDDPNPKRGDLPLERDIFPLLEKEYGIKFKVPEIEDAEESRHQPIKSKPFDEPSDGLVTVRLSEVEERPVEWQRQGFTALGKLTLLSGPPGVGKTSLMLDHIARLTTGRPFPFCPSMKRTDQLSSDPSPRRDALFISSEDAAEDTLKPRLREMDGDVTRCHVHQYVREKGEESALALSRHMAHLEEWLRKHPLVELVVLDPLSAILGDKVDANKNADVRRILGPLSKVADRCRVAIVGIDHFGKGKEGPALHRSLGSIGFVAAARLAWAVVKDEETEGRSLFLPLKCNLCETPKGRAFQIVNSNGCPKVDWDPKPVSITANEAVNGGTTGKSEEAREFLKEALKDGPQPMKELLRRAKDELNIGESTLKKAKRLLGVRDDREGGRHGHSVWSLNGE